MILVRKISRLLFYPTRFAAWIIFIVLIYSILLLILSKVNPSWDLPVHISGNKFEIFFPFTSTKFLLGDYTAAYLATNLAAVTFYGCFIGLLSSIFKSFSKPKLFTASGVIQLTRFYISNLAFPFIFLALLIIYGEEIMNVAQVIVLHLIIGVFAFFMAAIFKQGLILQEEQDLTF